MKIKAEVAGTGLIFFFLSALPITYFMSCHLKSFVSKALMELRVTSVNEKPVFIFPHQCGRSHSFISTCWFTTEIKEEMLAITRLWWRLNILH